MLTEVLTLFVLSVFVIAGLRRLRLPPIVGYLLVGVVAGPHALGWLEQSEATGILGEVGIAFLLFILGLEFSLPQFLSMKRTLFGLGGVQVLGGTLSGGLIAWALGMSWQAALVVGGALSMSSTAIVIKQLNDQLELATTHGRLALGILLFQDLAAVPFLVVIPILAAGLDKPIALPMLYALAKGVAAFALLLAIGRFGLRRLFHEVAASRELFTLTALLVSLAAAWFTGLLGLSLALGAFLAGMMLSETEYRHEIEHDIRPFRDVLLGLFFITAGMRLDLAPLGELWPWVVLLVAGLVLGKGGLIVLLTRLSGYRVAEALRTGLVLAHGGEFGLALLALGFASGLLSGEGSQAIFASMLISMALAPLLIRHNGPLAERLLARRQTQRAIQHEQELADDARLSRGHIVICGFGRVGQNLARFLGEQRLDYVGLDTDPEQIKRAWEQGDRVFYGDATRRAMLQAAGLERARAVVISFGETASALKTLAAVRAERGDVPILVRARDDAALDKLLDAGATEVVPDTLEASLMLASQLLLLLEVPINDVLSRMEEVRHDRYRLLRAHFRGAVESTASSPGRESLHTVLLPAGAFAAGRSLGELSLESHGVLLTTVRRDGMREAVPEPALVLQPGDVLILSGTPEHLARTERMLLKGERPADSPT